MIVSSLFVASTVNRIRAIIRFKINPMVILEKRTFDRLKPYLKVVSIKEVFLPE